ncbi:MAG: fluoride efflux transporter CrcB [Granulosicoccus sp.]|nr:fluoride efflux transporter CrcB [Granulosicoccus sp.]
MYADAKSMPMNMIVSFACVALGGALGACCRYALSLVIELQQGRLPLATLLANISGCFVAGMLVTWLVSRGMAGSFAHLLLLVGFLGSFTTLSAFSVESLRLFEQGHWQQAMSYIAISLTGALIAAWLGIAFARLLLR